MIGFSSEKLNGIKQKGFEMMEKIKRVLAVLIIFMMIVMILPVYNISASVIKPNNYRYKWTDDDLIRGSLQIGKTFYVTENMQPSNMNISLKLKPSPTLMGDLSSVSVLLNDRVIHSVMIDDLNIDEGLNITVEDHLISKGDNSLVIKGFLKSTREKCEINPDINWVIIEKGSLFSFDYKRVESTVISNIFEDTYYSNGVKGEINLAIPDKLTESNYSQIASLSALIGFIHKNKEVDTDIKLVNYSNLDALNKEAIVIGTSDQIKSFNKDLLTDKEWDMAKENGYIAIRKIGDTSHFILIVSDEEQLGTLIKILQNKSSRKQMKTKSYVLDKSKLVQIREFNKMPLLSELGYESSSQVGRGIKVFNYYFTIPANKSLTPSNKLSFAYNYSALSEDDNGYVTVGINGENILSKKLSGELQEDKIEFTIPDKYFKYTGFNIDLKFNLKPKTENCVGETFENVWVGVDSLSSKFNLDTEDRKEYSLLSSYGTLQDENGYLDGHIVVDSYDIIAPADISKIALYLGRVSQGVNKLRIINTDNNGEDKGAIFTLNTNPIPQELFIKNTKSLGFISMASDNRTLLISGTDRGQLGGAVRKYQEVISPNTSVVLQDGEVIDYFNDGVINDYNTVEEADGFIIEADIMLALATMLGFVVIAFAIYYRKIK